MALGQGGSDKPVTPLRVLLQLSEEHSCSLPWPSEVGEIMILNFTDKETEALRGDVSCPRPQGCLGPILQIQFHQTRAPFSDLMPHARS